MSVAGPAGGELEGTGDGDGDKATGRWRGEGGDGGDDDKGTVGPDEVDEVDEIEETDVRSTRTGAGRGTGTGIGTGDAAGTGVRNKVGCGPGPIRPGRDEEAVVVGVVVGVDGDSRPEATVVDAAFAVTTRWLSRAACCFSRFAFSSARSWASAVSSAERLAISRAFRRLISSS